MSAIISIIRANLRLFLNERGNLFWVGIVPLLLVFALGLSIGDGESQLRIGVVAPNGDVDVVHKAIVSDVAAVDGVLVDRVDSVDALHRAVSDGSLDGGWYVAGSRDESPLELRWLTSTRNPAFAARTALEQAVQVRSLDAAGAALLATDADIGVARAAAMLDRARVTTGSTPVRTRTVTERTEDDTAAGDELQSVLAGGMLTMFIFLTTLSGALYLVSAREQGVTRRVRAAPVSTSQIIIGEAASRYIVAAFQAAIIVVGCVVLFDVDWRSPAAVLILCMAMAFAGTGAAMLLAAVGRTAQQVSAVAIMLGLVLGALGGSMQPLAFFPAAMRMIAFAVTPHAWMNDALWRILTQDAGLADVWISVAVLFAIGAVLLGIASRMLARTLR